MCVSQRLSHIVFLTTSSSQRLSHNVFLTTSCSIPLPYYIRPQRHDIRPIFLYVICSDRRTNTLKYRKIVLVQTPIFKLIKLKHRRFKTLGKRLHTKVPRTDYCISNVNRLTDRRTDGRTERGIAIALCRIGWLGAKMIIRIILIIYMIYNYQYFDQITFLFHD